MEKSKKLAAGILASVLAMGGILSACGSGGAAGGEDSGGNTVPSVGADETLNISVAVMTGYTNSGSMIQQELEEKYNVKFDLVVLPGWTDGESKINLMMSSGTQRPDVIWWWNMQKEFTKWRDAGLLMDVSEYYNKYTNTKEYYESYSPDTMFYAQEKDGKMYRIPGDVSEPSCMTLLMRQDWLDNLNLPVPTTVDEYADVLRAFTYDDPDGNGQDDTYGWSGEGLAFRQFWHIFSAYGAYIEAGFDFIRLDDGSIGYSSIQPEVREALAYLADLYAQGLIDPTVMTQNDLDENFVRGGFGSTYQWVTWMNPNNQGVQAFQKNNPGGEWTSVSPLTGPDGIKGTDTPASAESWCYFGITDQAKDPERIYQVFDNMMGEEDYLFRMFGREGTDYIIDSNGLAEILTTDDINQKENIGMQLFHNFNMRKDHCNLDNSPEVITLFEQVAENAVPAYEKAVYLKDPDRPVQNRVKSEIDKQRDEYFFNIIAGNKPIEAFDEFVSIFHANGGDEWLQETIEYAEKQEKDYADWLSR